MYGAVLKSLLGEEPAPLAQLQMSQFGLPSVSVTEPLSLQAWHDVAAMHVPYVNIDAQPHP